MFRLYNIMGYIHVSTYLLATAFIAPPGDDPLVGLAIGISYFLVVWIIMGFYVGDVVHLGFAHRSADFSRWFIYLITFLANTIGIYMNPRTYTNRHRLHHIYSDNPGDPNKLAEDEFLKTAYLMIFPYPSITDLTKNDEIFKTWPMRFIANKYYAVFSQVSSFAVVYFLFGWQFALVLWCGVRWITLYVHLIQNYWTHEKSCGTRRYDDDDHAMNITNFLPVTLTFSACLQNNHHHSPRFVRTSHAPEEYDFGFLTMRFLYMLGIARPTEEGCKIPPEATLQRVGLGDDA